MTSTTTIPSLEQIKLRPRPHIHVLLAEDDPDDRLLIERAFRMAAPEGTISLVADGEQVLDYMHRRGQFSDPSKAPWPTLILLDLNMPRKDGHQVLREIKAVAAFRSIPIVILSTSVSERDIGVSYDLGVNAFISKPASFSRLKQTFRALSEFWFDVVKLPTEFPRT